VERRKDFYASPFGVAYSAYMERPRLGRLIARAVWGGDLTLYYESMSAIVSYATGPPKRARCQEAARKQPGRKADLRAPWVQAPWVSRGSAAPRPR
jgi:hypothetical protein